ncbi:MAG: HD domain-containing protein [Syntrophales bacterium]|nr:HD domain-containing protein [Syntrophales bacterium]
MDKSLSEAMEKLKREVGSELSARDKLENPPVVVLSGQSVQTRKLLLDREMVIRHFPFSIGRRRTIPMISRMEPEILIEDVPPFRISRKHVTLRRDELGIWLMDEKSAKGTVLDGKRLKASEAVLVEPGAHELILGGYTSPYAFSLRVVEDVVAGLTRDEKISLEGKDVSVSLLYLHLYDFTRKLLKVFFQDTSASVAMAQDMTDYIMKNDFCIDALYYYSAAPTIADDLIAHHSLNVFLYTLRLSSMVGIPVETRRALAVAALYHDLGMYDVPAEVVGKRDTLNEKEFEIIKSHSVTGWKRTSHLAKENPLIPAVAYEHHERIDGSGYPRSIKDLSPYVELVAMVDFFEAITHYRPQRGPITPHEGVRKILNMKEAIFRIENLKTFIKGFSLYPVYSVVRLNTGEVGQVVDVHPDQPLRPVVRLHFDSFGEALKETREVDLASNPNLYVRQDISDRVFIDRYFPLPLG